MTRPMPNRLSSGDTASRSRFGLDRAFEEKMYPLTSSKPFDDHSLFLSYLRVSNYVHKNSLDYLTMGSITAGSKNSFGTLTPLAVAARIYNPSG